MEIRYERALLRIVRSISSAINATLRPYLSGAREDAEIDTGLLGHDFGTLRIRVARMVREGEISPIVDQFGREIVTWNSREMRRILTLDLTRESAATQAALVEIRAANVALIQSIAERHLTDVFQVVTEGVIAGTRVEALARQIEERHDVSASRARLIARDQTLKANASLTEIRHSEAGITHYVWSSSRDERVREMHAALDGFVFAWADPPITNEDGDTNHPGEDINCRCVAIPVLDD